MNRISFHSILLCVFVSLFTLVSCSTPADYYSSVQYEVNKASASMRNIDKVIAESTSPIASADVEKLYEVKNSLSQIGPYKGESMLVVSSKDLLDCYINATQVYETLLNTRNDTLKQIFKEYPAEFKRVSQKSRLDMMKHFDNFAKKYELMHGMMVIE